MDDHLTLEDLARYCRVDRAAVVEWVELGLVEVEGRSPAEWRFGSESLAALAEAARLARELDLPPFAAALVRDLVAERRELERRVRLLERLLDGR